MSVVHVVVKVFEVLGYVVGAGLVGLAVWYVVDEFARLPADQRSWATYARYRQSLRQSARPGMHAAIRTRAGLLPTVWARVVRFLTHHPAGPGRS